MRIRRILQVRRRGGVLPRPRGMQLQICTHHGAFVQCFVGADDPVRPQDAMTNSHTPMQIRKTSVGADDHIGPHAAPPFLRNPSTNSIVPYGRGKPLPYGVDGKLYEFAEMHSNLQHCATGGQGRPPLQQICKTYGNGPMWASAPTRCVPCHMGAYAFATPYRREGQAPPLHYDEKRAPCVTTGRAAFALSRASCLL